MAGEVEEDGLLLAFFLRGVRLADRGGDGVRAFGRGDQPFGVGEGHRGGEAFDLRQGHGLEESLVPCVADERRHAVIAKTAGVDRGGLVFVAQRVHRQQRCHHRDVAGVVGEDALRHLGTGRGLHGPDARVRGAGDLVGDERERDAGEVRAAARAADDDVRIQADLLELLLRLEADDRLVEEHVVEHAAEAVLRVGRGDGVLDGLADGDAEAALGIRPARQHVSSGLREGRGAGEAFRPPGAHDELAQRLLGEADLDHVHAQVDAHHLAAEGQGGAPLAGAGFRRHPFRAGDLVVVGLRDGGVRLVAAGGRDGLVLEVDLGGRAEGAFEADGSAQRSGAPAIEDVADFVGNGNPALGADFLLDEVHRKDRAQSLGRNRLAGGVHRREHRIAEVGGDVVPRLRHLVFVEGDADRFAVHGWFP